MPMLSFDYWLLALRTRLPMGCLVFGVMSLLSALVKAEQIHIPVKVQATALEQPSDYFTTLLVMALEASKADNETIDIVFSPHDYSQARWINMLQSDKSNFVIWTMTDNEREQQMRPIRIPLFKGLFGYRVLLIRKQEQARFDQVNTRQDLTKFLGGQGTHWPDTLILQANGLRVTTAETTESLFRMIAAKRFDYFPRGVSEAWFELLQRKDAKLEVENKLLLYYPTAIYFFVNKNNEELAQRIEKGMEVLIDNGKFDQFFYNHPRINTGMERLRSRRIIELKNPYLPAQTPVNNPRYWIDLSVLGRE